MTVGVLGCGLMGSGIAQACAAAGFRTIVREVDEKRLQQGMASIEKTLTNAVSKGKMTEEAKAALLANLVATTDVAPFKDCDIVIEAIVEDIEVKRQAYAAIEVVLPSESLILSNTSSLSITALAATTTRPGKFAGLHFFNPVPLMKLVEVIKGLATTDETFAKVTEFVRKLGKEPVTTPDRPGFIVNRLLIPYLLDAVRTYENGVGTIEDIDTAMKLGAGHPMGPFTLLDFIGLDTTYYIANIMFDEFRQPMYAPPPLLKRMVDAGWLGKKSGKGFYSYAK